MDFVAIYRKSFQNFKHDVISLNNVTLQLLDKVNILVSHSAQIRLTLNLCFSVLLLDADTNATFMCRF